MAAVLPQYRKPGKKHVDRYLELNTVGAIQKREQGLKGHRRTIDTSVDEEMQGVLKDVAPQDADPDTKRYDAAAAMVTRYAQHFHKNTYKKQYADTDAGDIELEERDLDQFASEGTRGQFTTYKALLKHLVDNEGDLNYEAEGSALNAMREHAIQAQDDDGLESQKLQRSILNEHTTWDYARGAFADAHGKPKPYNATADGSDLIQSHQRHIRKQRADYKRTSD